MAYEEDLPVHEIFIEPPDANVRTDEDSGDEDSGGFLDNISGRQLIPAAELVPPPGVAAFVNVPDSEPVSNIVRPGSEIISWIEGDLESMTSFF